MKRLAPVFEEGDENAGLGEEELWELLKKAEKAIPRKRVTHSNAHQLGIRQGGKDQYGEEIKKLHTKVNEGGEEISVEEAKDMIGSMTNLGAINQNIGD